jgi:hypothetical protein
MFAPHQLDRVVLTRKMPFLERKRVGWAILSGDGYLMKGRTKGTITLDESEKDQSHVIGLMVPFPMY